MQYYSLNHKSPIASFKEATLGGQAPDKGLYFPQTIAKLDADFLKNISNYSKEQIAWRVIEPYVGKDIPGPELERIVSETINFDFPLVQVNDRIYCLELFHGPTLAFKDVGARFMSRCLGYFVRNEDKKLTVLVATSGDTGGAVANGFFGVDNVQVVILYPSGKVSKVQELQLTTYGHNISALEIDGNFDDCQRMVKQAFTDLDLANRMFLTSANSINVARWLPQQFYYFFAMKAWAEKDGVPVISVPSGNFGNICAGLLAHLSGLEASHFIAACNANDTIPSFLKTGDYQPKPAVSTLSNAMDVGDPSNFVRVLELFGKQFGSLKKILTSDSISDDQTRETIKRVYTEYQYLTDPHGAVGFECLEKYLDEHPGQKGIFLGTAHPLKFYDVVEPVIGQKIPIPESIHHLMGAKKQSLRMSSDFVDLKQYLLAMS
jgi:threonine synthase